MPWRDSHVIPLTRIDIVSQVPSESGVYAVMDNDTCLLVGEAWNLKARLLELMNILQDILALQLVYELCCEEERLARKEILASELLRSQPDVELPTRGLPGISFWNSSISSRG
jgi:hypothetical protein